MKWYTQYGIPVSEVNIDGHAYVQWAHTPPPMTVEKFHFAPRWAGSDPDEYIKSVKNSFTFFLKDLHKREKERYRDEKKKYPKLEQPHSAEWFVLYQVKGMDYPDISIWEDQRRESQVKKQVDSSTNQEIDRKKAENKDAESLPDTIYQGVKKVTDLLGATLRK